jgi:hypothetical protein
MDLVMSFLFWSALGAILCGLIGQSRDQLGAGLLIGVLLGPVLGGLLAWFAIPRTLQVQPKRRLE